MTIQSPDEVRARNNIPDDARLVSYFVGDGGDDAVNSFGSTNSPQPMKTHIQCVSRVRIRCANNIEFNTLAAAPTWATWGPWGLRKISTLVGSLRGAY